MKVILIIYLVISALAIILPTLACKCAVIQLKKEIPDIKFNKVPFVERLSALIRALIMALCPLFNLCIVLGYCLKWEDLVEQSADMIFEKRTM